MFNQSLEIYSNQGKEISTLSNLPPNSLLCSIVKPFEIATLHYIRYLLQLNRLNPNLNVYLVSHKPIARATIEGCLYKEELADYKLILDQSSIIHTWLANHYKKQKSLHWLKRYWLYTALINDQKVVFFNEQPTENQKEHIKKSMSPDRLRDIINNKKIVTFKKMMDLPESLLIEQESPDQFGTEYDHNIIKSVYYHNLWPNNNLDKYLKSKL
jgi:hypothetical protein